MVAGIQHLQKNKLLNVFGVAYKWEGKMRRLHTLH